MFKDEKAEQAYAEAVRTLAMAFMDYWNNRKAAEGENEDE